MNEPAVRYDGHNVRRYFAFGFLMDFALWSGIWIKYLIDDRGLELKWLLAMDLPFWLLVAVLQAPAGALADQIGRKRVLALGAILFSLTVLGFGFTQNYWMLFADYVLWAFAMSMRSGADSALLYDSLKVHAREDEFQRLAGRGFAIQLTAMLVSVSLGGVAAHWLGLSFIVQVSAVTPLLAAFVAISMREPPREHVKRNYLEGLRLGMKYAWDHPQVRYTLLIGSVLLAGTFGPVVLVQPFLIDRDVDTALFGIYQAPLRLTSVVAALIAFRVARRLGVQQVVVLACVIIIASYAGLAAIESTAAFAFFAMPSLVAGITRPVLDAHINDRTPSEMRATVLSVMQLCFSLQVAFFEPALGFFADGIALRWAFVFAACYFLLLMPPLLLLWRRAHRGGPEYGDAIAPAAAEPVAGG